MKILLAKSAEVNKANEDGLAVLYLAVKNNDRGVVQTMLEHGAHDPVLLFSRKLSFRQKDFIIRKLVKASFGKIYKALRTYFNFGGQTQTPITLPNFLAQEGSTEL